MTKEEEIPDWVGAKEFYDKYEPKEILGRYVCENLIIMWPTAEGHPTKLYLTYNQINLVGSFTS